MSYNVEFVLDAKAGLAETPIWHPQKQVVYWTDGFDGDFHIFDPHDGSDMKYETGEMIGSAIPYTDNRILLLLESGLKLLDFETKEIKHLLDVEPGNDANRLNDGRCDAYGRVWFSTVSKHFGSDDYQETMTGALYMVDTDLSLNKVLDGVNQLNGIGWSKDHRYMYVVDTYNFQLLRFEYDLETGQTGKPVTIITFPQEFSFADGLCIDDEDYIWVTHWGSKLTRWNPVTGKLVETVEMPVPHVTCCGFGGKDFDELYITTSRFAISESDLDTHPLGMSGGIFKIKPGVVGRECYPFKRED